MAEKEFDIVFEGVGTTSGKMRNDIAVHWPMMDEHFDLATDEGPFHGGDGTAPPPLALFTAALTGCLMTQIRAFSKRLRIPIEHIEIKAKMHWKAKQIDNDPYVSFPHAFDLDIDIKSEATTEDLRRLIEAAKKGCFIETSLAQGIEVGHRLKVGDEWQNC